MVYVIISVVILVIALASFCCLEVSGRYSEHEEEEDRK